MQSHPLHPDANYNLGLLAISAKKPESALSLFKIALTSDPNIEKFWLSYIDALIRVHQLDIATHFLEQAKIRSFSLTKLSILETRIKQKIEVNNPSQQLIDKLLEHYQAGRLEDAESMALSITLKYPNHPFSWKVLGAVLKQSGRITESLVPMKKSVQLAPQDAEAHYNLAVSLQEIERLTDAEVSYLRVLNLKPDHALAHSNLGIILYELGRFKEAEASYMRAIELQPDFADAHGNFGIALNAEGLLERACEHFHKNFQLERGPKLLNPGHRSFLSISKAKIDHDIEQFEYLANEGNSVKNFTELAVAYKKVSSEIVWASDTDIVRLNRNHRRVLSDTYNRPIHIIKAPVRDESAINKTLNVSRITNDYFSHEFGLTYIDDFLSPNTLASLRSFLLGSTIWFDFFHSGGYLGAYLKEGLASPLILQIAEDLRKKLPKIFKDYKLTQLWAYKYDSRASKNNNSFDGIGVHADFAAINVNFWITPNSANLDPASGGLVVYNTEAPLNWGFDAYNHSKEKILEQIKKRGGGKEIVPYKENRSVIFNSNLFHKTDRINFKEGYENRRINVTMLFGRRGL